MGPPSPRSRDEAGSSDGDDLQAGPALRAASGSKGAKRAKRGAQASGTTSTAAAAAAAGAGPSSTDVVQLLPHDLDEAMLRAEWRRLPAKHRNSKEAMLRSYRSQYPRWRFQLRQGFSLAFYGLGSKRALLEGFAREALTDGGVLAVYGHQPGVSARGVLVAAAAALCQRFFRGAGALEALAAIAGEPAGRRLYVVLHNMDGPGEGRGTLRGCRGQVAALRLGWRCLFVLCGGRREDEVHARSLHCYMDSAFKGATCGSVGNK